MKFLKSSIFLFISFIATSPARAESCYQLFQEPASPEASAELCFEPRPSELVSSLQVKKNKTEVSIQVGAFEARLVSHTRAINSSQNGFLVQKTYKVQDQGLIEINGSQTIEGNQTGQINVFGHSFHYKKADLFSLDELHTKMSTLNLQGRKEIEAGIEIPFSIKNGSLFETDLNSANELALLMGVDSAKMTRIFGKKYSYTLTLAETMWVSMSSHILSINPGGFRTLDGKYWPEEREKTRYEPAKNIQLSN